MSIRALPHPILGAASLVFAPLPTLLYALRRSGELPENSPRRFVERGLRRPSAKVVVCLGASIIHGRVSASIVDMLDARLSGDGYQLVNAGLNGDLAYNALQRLPGVIACRPDFVVVLVGTNDILSTLSRRNEAFYRRAKKLPASPNIAWYRENLQAIVARLREETQARVALCSLPVIGEDLGSPENRKVAAYNEVVREVAASAGAAFLPVHARMVDALSLLGHEGKPFEGANLRMLKATVQRYVLGKSFDEIASSNSFSLLTDGIHLNEQSAAIVADLVEEFLRFS